jgi:5'-3' exonuclease
MFNNENMTPHQELTFLKTFIQLSESEAIKRDMLEEFLSNRNKIVRLDSDSLAYNVASFWIKNDRKPDMEEMFQDLCEQRQNIILEIEESGINVEEIYHYFTTCKNNFRYDLCKEYKSDRKDSPTRDLARKLVHYTIHRMEELEWYADHSDTLEADDLISIHAKEYGHKDYITVSPDKDLRQILGAHFDYFKIGTGEFDVWGKEIKEYRGWSFTSPQDSYDMFMLQMLLGDSADCVKGANNVGKKRAPVML